MTIGEKSAATLVTAPVLDHLFGSPSTFRDTLRRRLKNLLDRRGTTC